MLNPNFQNHLTLAQLGRLLLSTIVVTALQTQEGRAIEQTAFCPDPGPIPPSEVTRSLELPQFRLNLTIPENFRAITWNDSKVEIVNPGTYQVLDCVARGGQALGRGYSSIVVRSLPNPDKMDLRQFVGQNTKLRGAIASFVWQGQQGYLVRSLSDSTAQFWTTSDMTSEVVVISSGCDCDGMFNRLLNLLERSSLLE